MTSSSARAYEPGVIPAWTFGDKLRKAREVTGLGQVEFAEAVGLAASTLGAYEKGRSHPRFTDVAPLARRLQMRTGIPYQWFLVDDAPAPLSPAPARPQATDQNIAPVASLAAARVARSA